MKSVSGPIWDTWNAGGFIVGRNQAMCRITVEKGWSLQTADIPEYDKTPFGVPVGAGLFGSAAGPGYNKGPVRWFQRADGSQVETEIPQQLLIECDIDQSVDQDAGTCVITMLNQYNDAIGATPQYAGEYGQMGYYSYSRGAVTNRWGHTANDWANVLMENALIRTYQGYGPPGQTLAEALTAGNLVQTGLWLVDEVDINTNTTQGGTGGSGTSTSGGQITLHCRDVMKLLIDQDIYPPLIPTVQDPNGNYVFYPMEYQRFYYKEVYTPVVVYGHASDVPHKYIMGIAQDGDGHGYWVVGSDGGVFAYGNNQFWGSLGGFHPSVFVENGLAPGATGFKGAIGIARAPFNPTIFEFGEESQYPNLVYSGYWIADANGYVYAFGTAAVKYTTSTPWGTTTYDPAGFLPTHSAGLNGATTFTGSPDPVIAICASTHHDGYWLLTLAGHVYGYGAGVIDHGGTPTLSGGAHLVGMASAHDGNGYWLVSSDGAIYAYGSAGYHGGGVASAPAVGMQATPSGNGYYIVDNAGGVFTFGDAVFHGSIPGTLIPTYALDGSVIMVHITLDDPVCGIDVMPDNSGYWLVAEDGGVFCFGGAQYYGSLPGVSDNIYPFDGNYADYTDVIKDLALWAGFFLYSPAPTLDASFHPPVFGNLESTGVYCPNILDDTIFDKAAVMDAMNKIKEVVGYIMFADGDGGLHFESANTWAPGNFLFETGAHTDFIPVIDEKLNLSNYQLQSNDTALRSQIIISTDEPYLNIPGVQTVTFVPSTAANLRGIVKTAEWVNEYFTLQAPEVGGVGTTAAGPIMSILAELIALQIFFQSRVGSVQMLANPCININDQVQIQERQTDEVYIHYVREISSTFNFQTGEYQMTLTTHMLGLADAWVVVPPSSMPTGPQNPNYPVFPDGTPLRRWEVSPELHEWLQRSPARATQHWPGSGPVDPPHPPQLAPPEDRLIRQKRDMEAARLEKAQRALADSVDAVTTAVEGGADG